MNKADIHYSLGIDPSLSDTGISILDNQGLPVEMTSIKTNRIGDLIEQRFERYSKSLVGIEEAINPYICKVKVICIEAYSYRSLGKKDALYEQGALIRDYLLDIKREDCKIIEVAPMSLKKFIILAISVF